MWTTVCQQLRPGHWLYAESEVMFVRSSRSSGAGLAVAGIVLILAPRLALAERAVNARLIGDTLAVCAVLLTACDANLYRRMAKNDAAPEPSSVTFMTFVSGSTILLALMSLIPAPIPADALRGSSLLLLAALAKRRELLPARGKSPSATPSSRTLKRIRARIAGK